MIRATVTASLLFTMLYSATAFAQSCDCTVMPIKPVACLPPCRNAVLLKANQKELKQDFKLDAKTADIFVGLRDAAPGKSDGTPKVVLPSDAYQSIVTNTETLSASRTAKLGRKYDLKKVEQSTNPTPLVALMPGSPGS